MVTSPRPSRHAPGRRFIFLFHVSPLCREEGARSFSQFALDVAGALRYWQNEGGTFVGALELDGCQLQLQDEGSMLDMASEAIFGPSVSDRPAPAEAKKKKSTLEGLLFVYLYSRLFLSLARKTRARSSPIRLSSKHRSLTLVCDSPRDREDWIAALRIFTGSPR